MSAATGAASASSDAHRQLSGVDIAKIMSSRGPVVKGVLLRASPPADDVDASDAKMPAKSTRQGDIAAMSVRELKADLTSLGVDASSFVEKGELVKALVEARGAANDDEDDGEGAKIVTQSDEGEDVREAGKQGERTQKGGDGVCCVIGGSKDAAVPLQHLISEIEVDTTPKKSMVSKILGGDFTFLGQYEDEGTMVMIRRPEFDPEDGHDGEEDSDDEAAAARREREDEARYGPVNPHRLQPPLHRVQIRGDILLMRVAKTDEELDEEAQDNENGENGDGKASPSGEGGSGEAAAAIHVPTNDEFFLDYTKDDYLKFAARTDIVAKAIDDSSSEEEGSDAEEEEEEDGDGKHRLPGGLTAMLLASANGEGGSDDDDDDDEDFEVGEEEEEDEDLDSEEHQVGMMNMILSHMLRKFREENGRGPDSLELLEMRKALADKLGVDVPPVDEEADDWDRKAESPKKRLTPGKKVVVAEERNETEEIPMREGGAMDSDDDEDGFVYGDEGADDDGDDDENVEDMSGEVITSLKRPAQDVAVGENCVGGEKTKGGNKKARVEEL